MILDPQDCENYKFSCWLKTTTLCSKSTRNILFWNQILVTLSQEHKFWSSESSFWNFYNNKMKKVVLGFSLLWTETMTTATHMKKTFNWGYLLAVSDVQSIIVMTGILVMFRQMWYKSWDYWQQDVIYHTEGRLNKTDLKALTHSNTLTPTRLHPLQQDHTF